MRILIAGATGVIGRPLVAALIAHGHAVTGLARSAESAAVLSGLGAETVVADVLDREATTTAAVEAQPDIVIDQLTALPRDYRPESLRAAIAATGVVRTVGGENLYTAAVAAGARRYLAQSGCSFYRPGQGLASETELWAEHGPPVVADNVGSLLAVERRVLGEDRPLSGVALRYGFFYGPNTWFHRDGDVGDQVRAGQYPVLGSGAGVWSFVHIDDAVAATVAAVESDVSGAFNICDGTPTPLREWLPAFARCLGAPQPPHVPVEADTDPNGRFYAELLRGADNALASKALDFAPRSLTWLEGSA